MSEIQAMLQRQAQWQRERARQSWADKIRQAERLRASILELRRMRLRPSAEPVHQASPAGVLPKSVSDAQSG